MDTTMIPDPLDVPESFANSKRPRNKRRNKETKESLKPQYYIPRQAPRKSKHSKDHNKEEAVAIKPKDKRQRRKIENHKRNSIILRSMSLRNWNFLWTKLIRKKLKR